MTQPDPETYVRAQTVLTVALAFVVSVAGWGVRRFVRVVDRLEDTHRDHGERIAVIETKLEIQPRSSAPQHDGGARTRAD